MQTNIVDQIFGVIPRVEYLVELGVKPENHELEPRPVARSTAPPEHRTPRPYDTRFNWYLKLSGNKY